MSDGITATDLCERCEEDKATVSRSLDYLENGGYLVCESKSAKRYKSPLRLTEKGKEIGNHLGHPREVVTRMLKYFVSEGAAKLSRGTVDIANESKFVNIAER